MISEDILAKIVGKVMCTKVLFGDSRQHCVLFDFVVCFFLRLCGWEHLGLK